MATDHIHSPTKNNLTNLLPLSQADLDELKDAFRSFEDPVMVDTVLKYGSRHAVVNDEVPEVGEISLEMTRSCGACFLPLVYPGRFSYAMGLALSRLDDPGAYVPHVWNLDADGRVVELGWDEMDDYVGVVVPTRTIVAMFCAAATEGERMPLVLNDRGRALLSRMGFTLDQAIKGEVFVKR